MSAGAGAGGRGTPRSNEFVLGAEGWPPLPPVHRAFLESALPTLRGQPGLVGLAAGGSFAQGALDAYSDLDLVVVTTPEAFAPLLQDGPRLAASLGPLLGAFRGEHVGEPRLLICMYGPPLLHVDLKFVASDALAERVEDPVVLWDRDGTLRAGLAQGRATYPQPSFQWIEDRIWTWVHYLAVKIARGELFEALDGLAFLRGRVLGPLLLAEAGALPNGVRRFEERVPGQVAALRATLGAHERGACLAALEAAVELYTALRERAAPAELERRAAAERAARAFLAGTRG